MNKKDLLLKCKELNIKGMNSKKKQDIIDVLNSAHHNRDKRLFNITLKQLLDNVKKDKVRKVCKQCNELGHGITSVICKININKNNKLRQKIKNYILENDCLFTKTVEEFSLELSVLLNISQNYCKYLYNEIPATELLNKHIDFNIYKTYVEKCIKICCQCTKNIICIKSTMMHIWKGKQLCYSCWHEYVDERLKMWEDVKKYRNIICTICLKTPLFAGDRFHYDHINMFDKQDNVCTMINEGQHMEDIYKEIDKCQILCFSCHAIVTDIENKIGFTRIKQLLTKNFNNNKISLTYYEEQLTVLKNMYEEKMTQIYEELKVAEFIKNKN